MVSEELLLMAPSMIFELGKEGLSVSKVLLAGVAIPEVVERAALTVTLRPHMPHA